MTKFFFVVGCGRSGTTMLQQALNRHSQIAIPPETAFFTFLGLSRRAQRNHLEHINADLHITLPLQRRRICRPAEARALYEQMARLYLARLDRPSITHFGEKSPEHLRRLDRIHHLFPDAKIILLYRDGRDVACRLQAFPWSPSDVYVSFAHWLHYYRLQQQAMSRTDLDILCVKYEELVTAPEAGLRKILDFLGLPFEHQVVQGSGNAEGIPDWELPWKARALEPISAERMGLWRKELTTEQIGMLERWGGAALRALGYELITDRRQRLPWWFVIRVYVKSFLWLALKPRYGSRCIKAYRKLRRSVSDACPIVPNAGVTSLPFVLKTCRETNEQ